MNEPTSEIIDLAAAETAGAGGRARATAIRR